MSAKPVSIVKQKAAGCGVACIVSACIDHGISHDHDSIVGGHLKHVLGHNGNLEGAFLPEIFAGFMLSLGISNYFEVGEGEQFLKDSEPYIQYQCVIVYYRVGHYVRLASVAGNDIRVMCPSRGLIVPIDQDGRENNIVYRCRKIGNDLVRLI